MAGTDPAATAVCDAGPLIHLSELGVLDLLRGFAAVIVPSVVWEEVERHRPGALGALASSLHRRDVRISLDPRFQAVVQALSLDAGEQAALSCDELQEGALLLTDDAAARLAAKALGCRAYGTLGVLLRAIRRQQRTQGEVLDLLRSIPSSSTLHIRRELLWQVIEEVERGWCP